MHWDQPRQLTDEATAITYSAVYDPYGVVTGASGASVSVYGYTGEMQDPSGSIHFHAQVTWHSILFRQIDISPFALYDMRNQKIRL